MNHEDGISKPPARSRRPFAIAIGVCVAWGVFLAFFGPKVGGGLEPPVLEGTGIPASADFTWAVSDLQDRPFDLAKFRGKPLVVNVWATWCPPCREEMPALANLAASPRFKALGASVVCVSAGESSETIRAYIRDKSWGMTVLRSETVPPVFATEGIPATFLVAPDGKVVASLVGSAKWDDPSVVDFLEQASKPAKP